MQDLFNGLCSTVLDGFGPVDPKVYIKYFTYI